MKPDHHSKRDVFLAPTPKLSRLPQKISAPAEILGDVDPESPNLLILLRLYLKLWLPLLALGALVGAAVGVRSIPQYSARVLLEIQPIDKDFLGKGGMDPFAGTYNLDGENLETQVLLLESGPFKQRVVDKMMKQPAPPMIDSRDAFSTLRKHLFATRTREAQNFQNALAVASNTFTVRIINNTRLVELSCESPHPVVTASFLNNIASEFVDDTIQHRNESSEKTRQWLASHLEETKQKLESSEEEMRAFVLQSGNVFAASDSTVDDVKVKQLQTEMALAETARIKAQAEYESTVRSDANAAPAILQDPAIAALRKQLADVEQQRTALLSTFKPMHPKVKALDDEAQELQAALKRESQVVTDKLKNEYQSALQHEKLLIGAYVEESQTVGSQASKAAEYAALHRNVESLRTMYDSLLQEMNKTEIAQSAPVIPVRLVEPSAPPEMPLKPKPQTDVLVGLVCGLALAIGIIFVREKSDRSVRTPESVRDLVKVPQLGVIPSLSAAARPNLGDRVTALLRNDGSSGSYPSRAVALNDSESSVVARAAWENRMSPIVDSFRATLAAINRHVAQFDSRVLLISSSVAREGKTSVVSNLGIALSEAGRRVVILDTDFRRPALSKVFPVQSHTNLADILRERRPIEDYRLDELVSATDLPGLYLIPSKATSEQSTTLIYSLRLPQLIERLRSEFELVLLDTPPILYPADARVIGQLVDGAIVVIRAGSTPKQVIRAAVGALYEDGVPIVGTILNDWMPNDHRSGMSYYSYYYSQSAAD